MARTSRRRRTEEGRDALASLLASHRPADRKEAEDIRTMLTWLESLPRPLSPDQPQAHFTASAVVVDAAGERVCLVRHALLDRWLQPGGHADASDRGDLERTAFREVVEETHLEMRRHPVAPRPFDVDVHLFSERRGFAAHYHLDIRFLLFADDPELLSHRPSESDDARWFTWKEALELTDEEAMRRMLTKAQRFFGHDDVGKEILHD